MYKKSTIMKIGLTYDQQVRNAGLAYKSITMVIGLYNLQVKSASWIQSL